MHFMDVRIDFSKDYLDIIYEKLKAVGWQGARDDKNIDIRFSNFQRRYVVAKKRKIFISRQLKCPAYLKSAYQAILEKITSGESIVPHLSRYLKDPDYNDLFLNDWGIHHLHLSTDIEDDGFTSRTGPVLLVVFGEDYALIIDVRMHGPENPDLWVQEDILEIIRINWPAWLEPLRLRGMLPAENRSRKDRKKIRRGSVNTFLTLSDGKSYMGPGMGITSAGTSTQATMSADKIRYAIRTFENNLNADPLGYKRKFWGDYRRWPAMMTVRLCCVGENYYAVAENSGTILGVYVPWEVHMSDAERCHMRVMSASASSIHIFG